jgi:antitoxin component YwqK of YwqJK toxin-antitoxin module
MALRGALAFLLLLGAGPPPPEPPTCPAGTYSTWGRPGLEGCRRPDGTPHGPALFRSKRGDRVIRQGTYLEGKRVGTWSAWHENGQEAFRTVYTERGKLLQQTGWFPNGDMQSELLYTLRDEGMPVLDHLIRWNEAGHRVFERSCLSYHESPHGSYCRRWRTRIWTRNGKLKSQKDDPIRR